MLGHEVELNQSWLKCLLRVITNHTEDDLIWDSCMHNEALQEIGIFCNFCDQVFPIIGNESLERIRWPR